MADEMRQVLNMIPAPEPCGTCGGSGCPTHYGAPYGVMTHGECRQCRSCNGTGERKEAERGE